jgi:hypothetical protein
MMTHLFVIVLFLEDAVIDQNSAAPRAATNHMRAAFFLAHPGHELRVYGWLEALRPRVYVLTDGGGRQNSPRIESSLRLIETVGASRGSLFGRFRDRSLYQLLLSSPRRAGDVLMEIAQELACNLLKSGTNIVIGDAVEGFSPSHDLMRELTNVSVHMAQKAGARIRNFSFALDAAPSSGQDARMILDDEGLQRKLAAAQAYPEMRYEVDLAIARFGLEAFKTESLDLVQAKGPTTPPLPVRYEDYGEARVKDGVYQNVITYEDHVRPWVNTIWSITH